MANLHRVWHPLSLMAHPSTPGVTQTWMMKTTTAATKEASQDYLVVVATSAATPFAASVDVAIISVDADQSTASVEAAGSVDLAPSAAPAA